jgi:hypothetical protein
MNDDENMNDDGNEEIISEEEILKNINTYSIEKLCDIIIANRYLGMFNKLHIPCMEELSRRRASGDMFPFEDYIENNIKDLPKLDFKITDIGAMINSIKKYKKI